MATLETPTAGARRLDDLSASAFHGRLDARPAAAQPETSPADAHGDVFSTADFQARAPQHRLGRDLQLPPQFETFTVLVTPYAPGQTPFYNGSPTIPVGIRNPDGTISENSGVLIAQFGCPGALALVPAQSEATVVPVQSDALANGAMNGGSTSMNVHLVYDDGIVRFDRFALTFVPSEAAYKQAANG